MTTFRCAATALVLAVKVFCATAIAAASAPEMPWLGSGAEPSLGPSLHRKGQ